MRDLPGTEKRVNEVRHRFTKELDFASRIFSFWMDQSREDWLRASELPPLVQYLTRLLDIQNCRQFRSVIGLSSAGEALNAGVIARSLYETTLKLFFLIKPDFSIAVVPLEDKRSSEPKPNGWRAARPADKNRARQQTLDREFRAKLVYAHSLFADEKELIALAAEYPALTATGPNKAEQFSERAAEMEKQIGLEWTYILRNPPKTYSGLKIVDLASALDNWCELWYEKVYRSQSREVHAATMMWHGQVDSETYKFTPNWFSPNHEIRSTIYCGTTLFIFFLTALQNFAGFGGDVNTVIEGFWKDYQMIYPGTPGID